MTSKLLVVAIDDPDKAVVMVETAKTMFPNLKILARSIDRPHTYRMIKAGVDWFARETFGSALATGEEALRQLGLPDAKARQISSTFEKHDTEGLYKLYEVWGDDEAYGFRIRQNIQELERVLQDDILSNEEEAAESALDQQNPEPGQQP